MREIGLGCNKDMADAIKLHEEAAAKICAAMIAPSVYDGK